MKIIPKKFLSLEPWRLREHVISEWSQGLVISITILFSIIVAIIIINAEGGQYYSIIILSLFLTGMLVYLASLYIWPDWNWKRLERIIRNEQWTLYDMAQNEWNQGMVRLAIIALSYAYIFDWYQRDPEVRYIFYIDNAVFFMAFVYLMASYTWPEGVIWRRYLSFFMDMIPAILIALWGEGVEPVIAVLVWVILGYGIRYGIHFLVLGGVTSLITLVALWAYHPYWHEKTLIMFTFISITAMIPVYIYTLLYKKEQAMKSRERFMANISHEIRTPLTGIIGMSQNIIDKEKDVFKRKDLSYVVNAAEGLLLTLNNILDYSAHERGMLQIKEKKEFRVKEIITDVINTFESPIEDKGIQLKVENRIMDDKWHIGNKSAVRQILFNLVSNALKYTEKGEITIRVSTVDIKEEREIILFEVEDTGIGIPENEQNKVFEPFCRISNAKERVINGSGLGMTISVKMAESIGARLSFVSKEGEGSTFSLLVPMGVGRGTENDPGISKVHNMTEDKNKLRSKYAVLVVEDTMIIRRTLLVMIEESGYQVWGAENGKAAQDYLESIKIGLVIVDRQMPIVDGPSLVRWMRKSEEHHNTPVIMLSATSSDSIMEKAKQDGVDTYLEKPVDKYQLVRTMDHLLGIEETEHKGGRVVESLKQEKEHEVVQKDDVLEIIDKNVLNKLGDDPEYERLFTSLLTMFKDEASVLVDRLESSAKEQNWKEVMETAHALKGISDTMGSIRTKRISEKIEIMNEEEMNKEWKNMIVEVRKAYNEYINVSSTIIQAHARRVH